MSTKFQLFDASKSGEEESSKKDGVETLREPILAAFPNRMPTKDELQEMKFTIKQQVQKKDDLDLLGAAFPTKKRRVIRCSHNNLDYTATSFGPQAADRSQCQDYYLGVIAPKNPSKVYMIPVQTPYQFVQEIKNF